MAGVDHNLPAATFVCSVCGAEAPSDPLRWRCACGGAFDLRFTPRFARERIVARAPSLWRYREALPIHDDGAVVTLGEGLTPLIALDLGRTVWLKQDQLFSSGSFKDRGASLLISHARALGVHAVVEDSSGNAGAAIAAYCARSSATGHPIACTIYVPASTSPAKLAQIAAYGAHVERVAGSRDETARAVRAAAAHCYYASHVWNPCFIHGCKTFAYELWEQMGWRAPDTLVLPVGNGTLLLGAALGFRELLEAGEIARVPRLIAVQAAACAPLATAFSAGAAAPLPVTRTPTLAEGIAIAEPARGAQVLAAVRASGGQVIAVDEPAIADAHARLARAGLYTEPTAAATIAGLLQELPGLAPTDCVASVLTGHGLKNVQPAAH
ncbi:MAG: pyridoxal-phosphate dependent enzyme [Chloroflexi bacterium]|nr:pyridoxal-phosphate dependent enzyme [Chloroflexota bacterium]